MLTLQPPRRVRKRDVKPHVSHVTKLIVSGKPAHFIRGGDLTAGGILHAITSVAQTVDDAGTAQDMEAHALDAMHLAARA